MSGRVSIINVNENANVIISAAGRISTTKGSADEIYEKSSKNDNETNTNLIEKILLSGHQSVLEHVTFNLSFDNVSVFVEQFMIEFRLASFTVKSRRYVDFSNMGYYEPPFDYSDNDTLKNIYENHMNYLFKEYEYFVEKGIPKEDARFVLPYSFKSNFYCTVNARELLHILEEMIYGRGAKYTEIRNLGHMLLKQCQNKFNYFKIKKLSNETEQNICLENIFSDNKSKKKNIEILQYSDNADDIVCEAYKMYSNKVDEDLNNKKADIIKDILKKSRRRELEQVNFTIKFNNISLSGLTHLVRHRIQSIIVPEFLNYCNFNNYIIPKSIIENGEEQRYRNIFAETKRVAEKLLENGLHIEDLVYMFLSGMTIPVITTMNGNELFTFLRLRTCNRAQWEIKGYADEILCSLRKINPLLFSQYGPSCFVFGVCPEGKMSCGELKNILKEYTLNN